MGQGGFALLGPICNLSLGQADGLSPNKIDAAQRLIAGSPKNTLPALGRNS